MRQNLAMKKNITIFFLFTSLVANTQNRDSDQMLLLKIDPILMFSQSEYGGLIEYSLNKYFSLEGGGGAMLSSKNGTMGNGFTLRAGFRFYPRNNFYLNPTIFYRHIIYNNREYDWQKDGSVSGIFETHPGIFGYTGSDESYKEFGNEQKQVFGIQMLVGWEFLLHDRLPLDIYFGLGYRSKHRVLEIYDYQDLIRNSIWNEVFYSPPQKEIINDSYMTFQFGFRFGFAFKLRNHISN